MRRVLLPALGLVVLGACDGGGDPKASPSGRDQLAPSEVTGVITDVQSSGLTEVESFTVRNTDNEEYEILLDPETDLGFPPAHLNEHRTSGDPVIVEIDERAGELFATSVEDAG